MKPLWNTLAIAECNNIIVVESNPYSPKEIVKAETTK